MSLIQPASASCRLNSKNAGFSLIEVLAALVLTSLLIMALMPLVGQMLATWARGGDVASMVEFRVKGIGVLRDDLKHAVVWTGYGRLENLLVFRGNERSMIFPAASGLGAGSNGLQMLSIEVANSADGQAIIRRQAPIIGTTYAPFANPVVLFSGPDRYFFSYYSRGGEPKSVWSDPLNYPAGVAINVVDRRGRLSNLLIEMPIFASISAACFNNTALPGCPDLGKPLEEDDPSKTSTQLGQ
jgi:prepilin-type N-terminal cleavage/methylation domain-containing protein